MLISIGIVLERGGVECEFDCRSECAHLNASGNVTAEQQKLYSDADVRAAYALLRALGRDALGDAARAAKPADVLLRQVTEQERELAPAERERRADLALAEGAVELLERVAALREPLEARTMAQLATWPGYCVLIALCNVLSYRAPHSPRLAARLALSVEFIASDLLRFRWFVELARDDHASIALQNQLLLCDVAPAAIGRYRARGLYADVLALYSRSKCAT